MYSASLRDPYSFFLRFVPSLLLYFITSQTAVADALTETREGLYTGHMEVRFTPEQEARLSKIATQEGVDPEEIVKDAALRLLEDDVRFRAGVRKGLEEADRGEFIEEQEMDACVKRMFRS